MAEYVIDEELARRAQESWSWSDYKKGSTTEYYNSKVAEIEKLAEDQKKKTDPMYHDHIDNLVEKYKRKLAENINARNANTARVPSVMIAGPANFPVRKKEKQNARENALWEEFNKIENIANQIKSAGTAGISADSENAINKIAKKISDIEQSTAQMKAINAYYKKNKTLDGIEKDGDYNAKLIEHAKWSVGKYPGEAPFSSYNFSGNSAEIRRLRDRLVSLNKSATEGTSGDYTFNGGTIKNNTELNRLQIFFDERPDSEMVSKLKKNGFHWSPSNKAWQRQTTDNAKRAIENYLGLDGLTSTGEKTTKAYAISEEAQKVIDSANTKKAEAAARKQAKEERSKEFNDFLDQHGFYALSKEQLDEGRANLGVKEGEKVISIGYGYFIDPKYKDEYIERFVKKKPSSKKAAPASAETAKLNDSVYDKVKDSAGNTYLVTNKIDPSWSEYDKTVAQNQLDDRGYIVLDTEYKQPVDNEYVLYESGIDYKPKTSSKSAATEIKKPRVSQSASKEMPSAQVKAIKIPSDNKVTIKVKKDGLGYPIGKTVELEYLGNGKYAGWKDVEPVKSTDWRKPKSAENHLPIDLSELTEYADIVSDEGASGKELERQLEQGRKDLNIATLIDDTTGSLKKGFAFFMPSKQFGRLIGFTTQPGVAGQGYVPTGERLKVEWPDGTQKNVGLVYDPDWESWVFYNLDNGRELLVVNGPSSNDDRTAKERFIELSPTIARDLKDFDKERQERLQDPQTVAAELADMDVETRIRRLNRGEKVEPKIIQEQRDMTGGVLAMTDFVNRKYNYSAKARNDEPAYKVKTAGASDWYEANLSKKDALERLGTTVSKLTKVGSEPKKQKPEYPKAYLVSRDRMKTWKIVKDLNELGDEKKDWDVSHEVEIAEEHKGIPILKNTRKGDFKGYYAKPDNSTEFILGKTVKDTIKMIDKSKVTPSDYVKVPNSMRDNGSQVSRYQQRLVDAYDRLAKSPIALKYIPKDFVGTEAIGKMELRFGGLTPEEIKEIPGSWEANAFALANQVYWEYVELDEDGDVRLDVEQDLGHINTKDQLEKWEEELTEKYPTLMSVIEEDQKLPDETIKKLKAATGKKAEEPKLDKETPKEVVKEMMQKADVKDLGGGVKAYSLPVLADNVKQWYKKNYPTDELGDEINKDITFRNVLASVEGRGDKDVYELLDVGDSVVRERVFEGLAERSGMDYGQIYDKWLESGKVYEEKARRPKSMSSDTDDYWKDFWNEFSMDGYELFRKSDHKFVTKANDENGLLHKLRAVELAAKASDTKPDYDYIRQVANVYDLGLSSIAYGQTFKEDNRYLVDNKVYAIDDKSKKAIVDYVNSDIVAARVFAGTDSEGNNYVSLRLKPFDDAHKFSPGYYEEVLGSDGRTYRVTDKINPLWDKKWKKKANEWLSKFGYIILNNLDGPSPIDDTFAPRLDYAPKHTKTDTVTDTKSQTINEKKKTIIPNNAEKITVKLWKDMGTFYKKAPVHKAGETVELWRGSLGWHMPEEPGVLPSSHLREIAEVVSVDSKYTNAPIVQSYGGNNKLPVTMNINPTWSTEEQQEGQKQLDHNGFILLNPGDKTPIENWYDDVGVKPVAEVAKDIVKEDWLKKWLKGNDMTVAPKQQFREPTVKQAQKPLTEAEWKALDGRAYALYNKGAYHEFEKFSDRELVEMWKRCILSQEFPWGRGYDDEVYDAIADRPNSKELFALAKAEFKNEFTPLGELPKKSSAAKLTEPKKAMISWKQGAVRYGHGDDKKMKALWVVVTKEGGKWQAKFTTETPEGRKEEAGRPYTVKDSIKISGDIPADVQVQLGMFNVSFQDGKPVFKKIKGYVPKKKREKTEKSKIKLPTQKQLSKRI